MTDHPKDQGEGAGMLPWRIIRSDWPIDHPVIVDAEDYWIAVVNPNDNTDADTSARLIVEAVNSHAELKKALRDIARQAPASQPRAKEFPSPLDIEDYGFKTAWYEAAQIARAVLAILPPSNTKAAGE